MHRFKIKTLVFCGLLAATPFAALAAEDTVLIERGDVRVTEGDFTQLVNSLVPEKDRPSFMTDQKRLRSMLLDNYVVEALADEAKDLGLDKAPEVVFRQQYQAKKDLAQYYLTSLLNQKQPNWEQLVKESYIAKKDQFAMPEQVSVSHILIAINDKRDDAQAAKLADEVYAKAVAGKEDFSALVKTYSDDPSAAQNQGDMGFFGPGQMVKPFEDASFAMSKPGSIGKPVKTQFGYHIIRFNERKPAGTMSLDEVKGKLLGEERAKFAASVREKKLTEIRSNSDIKVHEAAVDDLLSRMAEAAKAK